MIVDVGIDYEYWFWFGWWISDVYVGVLIKLFSVDFILLIQKRNPNLGFVKEEQTKMGTRICGDRIRGSFVCKIVNKRIVS